MNPWPLPRRIRGFVFLVLFGFLGLAAQAQTNISRSGATSSWGPRVTVDSSGAVHAVWLEVYSATSGDIFYSKLATPGGTWTTPLNISNSGLACTNIKQSYHEADIDHDANGNIYVVWAETPLVKLRILSGGNWGSVFTVKTTTTGVDGPLLAVDGTGNIFVTWWCGFRVWTRVRLNGQWENPVLIGTSGIAGKYPYIAVGTGTIYAVWMQKTPKDYRTFWSSRSKTLNAKWTTPKMVWNGPYPQCYPAVAVDSAGVAHVVYLDEPSEGIRTAMYSKRTSTGFSKPIKISTTSCLHYTSMSVLGTKVYAQWHAGAWGNGTAIRYNTRISGKWTGQANVPNSRGCTYGDIEADPNGLIHFVWDCNDGEIYYCAVNRTAALGLPELSEADGADYAVAWEK